MELQLTGDISIKDLNKSFNLYFPYLRIEFYKTKHNVGDNSYLINKVKGQTKLSEIDNRFTGGVFIFQPTTTVGEFEQAMQNLHGLPVQVFRMAGDIWIETTETDDMTLQFANALGAASIRKIDFNVNMFFL